MFDYKYLSKQHLKGFSKYKYSAIDTSPLSKYVMHPSWNAMVNFIPKSIAPNTLTFAGFICMVIVVGLMYVYDYQLYGPVPDYVYTVSGGLVFLAYNLDGIDGKQARRLGVSGPLGELFDHGLDSYIVFLIPFSVLSIFGRDPEYSLNCFRGFLIVLSIVLNFYISHLEKYNTGTLYLPWGYDFSMWITTFLFIGAGAFGPEFYKFYFVGGLTFARVFEIVVHLVGLLTTLPVVIYNIYMSYKNRTGQMHSPIEAIRPVWSLLTVTVATIYWAFYSHNNIVEYDPRAFIFLYGTLFSNIASRLIIAEMSHTQCDLVHWFLWPYLAGIVLSLTLPQLEVTILYALMVTIFVAHMHYGICVVRQICDHLKISCFTVPKEKRR